MFNGMMDPEMIRLAQQKMDRMSPAEISRIQQQMMSNPELMKLASDSMKNMKPEDLRRAAQQLQSTQPDQMAEIGAKMANAPPDEVAAMSSRVDAQINYQLNAAYMLKEMGNELHSQGMFNEALEKYLRAKNNLKDISSSKGGTLLLACSLNLMSCYLKTSQFDECIKEGIEVLATDTRNVKALYRRGQAYKSLGQLENAVSDLTKALELSPHDETIADVLRDAKETLTEHTGKDIQKELKIEEISEEVPSQMNSQSEYVPTNIEYLQSLKDDKESIRSFQSFMSQADAETLASAGDGTIEGISPDMVKTASNVITNMPPEEFQKMLEMATSFQGNNLLNSSSHRPGMPGVTPDMLRTTTDMMNKMPAEDLQNMFKMSSSTDGGLQSNGSRLNTSSDAQERCENTTFDEDIAADSSSSSSSFDKQEQIKRQLNNPAMREIMSSMMKNMNPDMMANMSEQFGYKLSREDAERAQQAMSSLSPDKLDKMIKWANRIQGFTEGARNTKNWLLGKQGLVMAVIMLLLAICLSWLGYFGHR